MSHFTVLVIGDNPEGQLEPFQENNMGDCPSEYMEFNDMEDELREEYESTVFDSDYFKESHPEWYKKTAKEVFSGFDEFVEEYHGHNKDEESGRYGYWENPNAKWDWYAIGGRWAGSFKLKPGATGVAGEPGINFMFGETPKPKHDRVDQAKKGDIDWEGMMEASRLEAVGNWEESENAEDDFHKYYMFSREEDDTRETYIDRTTKFSTFAVLKDGKWYERGSMGWWGAVSDEKDKDSWTKEFENLIKGLDDDTLLTVIDCHI